MAPEGCNRFSAKVTASSKFIRPAKNWAYLFIMGTLIKIKKYGVCRPKSKALNRFIRCLNLRISTQVLDQASLFFGHPKSRHEFGELQTEVIGIQCRCLLLHQ